MKPLNFLLASLLLTSCSHKIHSGKITEKIEDPVHYETTYIYSGDKQTGIMIPISTRVDAQYSVTLSGFDSDGKHHFEDFTVSQQFYNSVTNGQQVSFPK